MLGFQFKLQQSQTQYKTKALPQLFKGKATTSVENTLWHLRFLHLSRSFFIQGFKLKSLTWSIYSYMNNQNSI